MNSENERIIEELSAYVFELIESSDMASYDEIHIKQVAYFSQKIAKQRQLDSFTARCIALLHDIGKIKESSYLKGHGKSGALIAYNLLKDYGIEENRIRTVSEAIRHHSKKKKIHDSYSELIKDADALAHMEEGPIEWHEEIRGLYAYEERLQCQWCHLFNYVQTFQTLITQLSDLLKDMAIKTSPHESIHDIRVTIRKIRALIWLVVNSGQEIRYKEMNELDKALKRIFKDFEKPRELYILYSTLHEELNKKEKEDLEKKLKKATDKAQKKYKDYLLERELLEDIQAVKKILQVFHTDSISTDYILTDYIKALQEANVKNGTSLHQLRIDGKRLKYLYRMGCVTFDSSVHKHILKLHDVLGDYHDVEVNQEWGRKWAFQKTVFDYMEKEKKVKLQAIKPLLFELKIMTKITK